MIDFLKEEDDLSDKGKEFLEIGQNSTNLLRVYVGDLLDCCLLRNDKFYIRCYKFDVMHLLSQSIQMLQLKAKDKGISLAFINKTSNSTQAVTNDEGRIQQVLINLLSNAIKFTPKKGKIVLSVSKCAISGDLLIQIEDNGIGIRENDLGKLFTEFGRVVNSQTTELNPQGVGLGLWICQRICSEIGQGISVYSKYSQGSRFNFTIKDYDLGERVDVKQSNDRNKSLPEGDTDEQKAVKYEELRKIICLNSSLRGDTQPAESPMDTLVFCHNDSILIVDDEPVNRFVLSHFCQKLGLPTVFASDGVEALEIIHSQLREETSIEFRLIILDYQMPGMTGPELCCYLRKMERDKKWSIPPIIGYTAFISTMEMDYFIECGAEEILDKPASFGQFKTLIFKYL